jgi:hypothetical protein
MHFILRSRCGLRALNDRRHAHAFVAQLRDLGGERGEAVRRRRLPVAAEGDSDTRRQTKSETRMKK